LLVAVTVSVPAAAGAVYAPDELMLPEEAVHVTDLSETVPWTVAANCRVPFVVVDVEAGETVTEVTTGFTAGTVTVTRAEPDFVGSALLVAVTVTVPALAGAE
jgi:hypothetical protein